MFQYLLFVVALLSPLRLSDARELGPDPAEIQPSQPENVLCCDREDRVCCDGQCHPPGTVFERLCESNSCGCPDEELQPENGKKCCKETEDGPTGGCCGPNEYCCYNECFDKSVAHVWCGPPNNLWECPICT